MSFVDLPASAFRASLDPPDVTLIKSTRPATCAVCRQDVTASIVLPDDRACCERCTGIALRAMIDDAAGGERTGASMKVKDMSFEPVSFDAFADKHGLVMEIRERPGTLGDGRYYAHFERCEVMDRGCLIGAYGNGATKEAAIADYARALAGKRIAIDAFGVKQERREIQCPNEWDRP